MDGCGAERNKIRIAAHEADVTAVLHDRNDVAGEQRTFIVRARGPVQHRASFEMSAAIDQREIIPKWQGRSFPELNARTFAHDPLSIFRLQKDLRVKMVGPFDHRRVEMRVRNRDGANTAARFHFGDSFFVQQRNAIPEKISTRRLQEQRALADGELGLCPDAEKVRRFIFETVVMIGRQAFERYPCLAAVTNELAFVFANCATRRRVGSRAKLRSALHADKVLHREMVRGQDGACPSNFFVGGTTSASSHYCSRQRGGEL